MRRRTKYDIYIVAALALITVGYLFYDKASSENHGTNAYALALESYKNLKYDDAYQKFGKVPTGSSLKEAALFRQARCATNTGKKNIAIKKYARIVHSHTKSSIVPISEYNMATLMLEQKNNKAKKHFKNLQKKYPTSDYAIAANYYLGLIELQGSPRTKYGKEKQKERALEKFKIYIEQAPDGRFATNCAEEIVKLDTNLHNYDYLLLAKVYYENGEYDKSKKYLEKTTLSESWPNFVKTEFRLKNNDKVRYYTEYGLKNHADAISSEEIYGVIDNYLMTFNSRKEGINTLVSKNYNSNGADYIAFLKCSETKEGRAKEACFKDAYKKYPNGQFSAEMLYNFFILKYLQKDYGAAQNAGYIHLSKFHDVSSSPAVMFYMGKISHKNKHYEHAHQYFKKVIEKYPDTYYAYRANRSIYKEDGAFSVSDIKPKPVVFPYKKSLEGNLVLKLALLKDYDLVEELCKKDKFIQSWVSYEKGNYTISAILARQAMEELKVKPPFSDLRWRLIYPLHYYSEVERYKGDNNPVILESIIKEESHFNPYARSGAGASGLMQLMPATYAEIVKDYGLANDIYNPKQNIHAGSIYYKKLKRVLGNKDLYAISAYNGGMGSVTTWFTKLVYNDTDEFVEQIPYPETKNYVKKVLRSYWMYGNIY